MSQQQTHISLSRSELLTALLHRSHREFSLIQITALTVPSLLPLFHRHRVLLIHSVILVLSSHLILPQSTVPNWGECAACLAVSWAASATLAGISVWVRVSHSIYVREARLAQGDCGPNSASMCMLGEAATPVDAVTMRVEVLQYMLSKQGRAKYGFCQENEKEQPGALDEVIEEGKAARDWVGHDWFTCFGSMLDLNVFVLSKLIRREEPVEVTYGIRLVTNAGAFIETDDANTVAVYYQGELPRGQERAPGHWESVWDKHGDHIWRHDHPTVQHCLLIAAQAMKLQVTRRQQISKMLMAAQNRNNNANEVIGEGDIVWLSVPDKVIAAVKQQLRKTMEQQYTDRKMLVKVWKVTHAVSHFGRGVTEHFTIFTQDGLLEDTYPHRRAGKMLSSTLHTS